MDVCVTYEIQRSVETGNVYDILGRVCANVDLGVASGLLESTMLDAQVLSPEGYFLELVMHSASMRTLNVVEGE